MRVRARVDKNQVEIVNALRKAGRTVRCLHQLGNGAPDLLVGFRGVNYLLEIKYKKGKLTDDQKKFFADWNGTVYPVYSAEEAITITEVK